MVLAFIIVASGNDDVHSDHAQDEHVEHRGPHQLLWKQSKSSIVINVNCTQQERGKKEEEEVHHFVSTSKIKFWFWI